MYTEHTAVLERGDLDHGESNWEDPLSELR